MTKRQHDTRVALRRALHIFGPNAKDTEVAAIQFCYSRNIDPHFRYPLGMTVNPTIHDYDKPAPIEAYSETEWQRVVRWFQKEDAA